MNTVVIQVVDVPAIVVQTNVPSPSGLPADVVQQYTSGSALTHTAGANIIQVNPATLQAALAITTNTIFHASNDLYIVFGGTITSGNPVVTAFSIIPGAGLTLVDAINPSGPYVAGEVIRFKKIGSFLYRID